MMKQLLEDHAEALLKKCMVDALRGDRHSMKLCLERLLPPERESTVDFALPRVKDIASVNNANERLIRAIGRGEMTPGNGQIIGNLLESRRRIIETQELVERVRALEERQKESPSDEA